MTLREALAAKKKPEASHSIPEKIASVEAPSWPCPHCGQGVEIESVEPSRDGERMLTFWHCPLCQSYAVTPDTIKEPPAGWGTKRKQ